MRKVINISGSKWHTWLLIVVLWCLITVGAAFSIASYAALLIIVIAMVTCNDDDVRCILFATVPFANVFKTSPDSQSMFTMIIFLYVGWNVIKLKKIDSFTIYIVLYAIYLTIIQLSQDTLDVNRTIKFVVNFAFLYYALINSKTLETKKLFLSYIMGIIIASLVKLSELFPSINNYVNTVIVGQVHFDNVERFAGLYNDPNYYAINVIIALCLIVIMFHRKELSGKLSVVLAGVLVVFVGLTISKSAILMLTLPALLLMYSNSKNRRHFIQLLSITGVAVFALLIVADRIELFRTVLGRLSRADNLVALTTGRSRIWHNYFSFFANSDVLLIFGNGLGAGLLSGYAAHNTYIDLVYYMGIVGTCLTMSIIYGMARQLQNKNRKNLLNYSIVFCLMIMYIFLSQLFYFDLVFQLYLAIIVLKIPLENKRGYEQ